MLGLICTNISVQMVLQLSNKVDFMNMVFFSHALIAVTVLVVAKSYWDIIKEKRGEMAMKKVRITAVRKACYPDLMERYENPIEHACDVQEGQVWIANGWSKPAGFCDSAWDSISPFVMTLAHGGGNFYDGWMKNPKSAMISCNDGFRPVSFYLEALDEEV